MSFVKKKASEYETNLLKSAFIQMTQVRSRISHEGTSNSVKQCAKTQT